MNEKSVSVRITAEEFEALKLLARREVRTISSWIRARIVSESEKAGISTEDSQINSVGGERQPNLDLDGDSLLKE